MTVSAPEQTHCQALQRPREARTTEPRVETVLEAEVLERDEQDQPPPAGSGSRAVRARAFT